MPNNVGDKGRSNTSSAAQCSNPANAYTSTDALREALAESEAALMQMRDLARRTPALQGRQYVDLGILVNKAIDEARAALSGSPPPSTEGLREWLPIETAPKDGTHVLAFGPEPGANAKEHGWTEIRETHFEHGGWDWYDAVHNWSHKWKPTHWMPLPLPPDAARTALAPVEVKS